MFSGYLDQPDATAAAFDGRWYRTGDVGTIDAHGYVSITGRASELIITGGMNVFPVEIESVRAALASPTARADQKGIVGAVQEAGITSVPYFVFDEKLALSGGQPVPAFLQALEQASEPALAR